MLIQSSQTTCTASLPPTFLVCHILAKLNEHTYCPAICSVCSQQAVLDIWPKTHSSLDHTGLKTWLNTQLPHFLMHIHATHISGMGDSRVFKHILAQLLVFGRWRAYRWTVEKWDMLLKGFEKFTLRFPETLPPLECVVIKLGDTQLLFLMRMSTTSLYQLLQA